MDDPLFFASGWLLRVSVFACVFRFFVCQVSRVYRAGVLLYRNAHCLKVVGSLLYSAGVNDQYIYV